MSLVTFTVWREIGLDVAYLREDDHIIWTKIDTDPSKVMPDMHGRTTGLDEDKSLLSTIRRMFTASANSHLQDEISVQRHLAKGFEPTREDYHRSLGNKFQRMFWATGAEFSYGVLDAELTWYLLMHSLEKYPEDVVIEEGVSNLFDDIISEIKENRDFCNAINAFLE